MILETLSRAPWGLTQNLLPGFPAGPRIGLHVKGGREANCYMYLQMSWDLLQSGMGRYTDVEMIVMKKEVYSYSET